MRRTCSAESQHHEQSSLYVILYFANTEPHVNLRLIQETGTAHIDSSHDIYHRDYIVTIIYWAPKETIHSIDLKSFYSKNETLIFVVRNVILGV